MIFKLIAGFLCGSAWNSKSHDFDINPSIIGNVPLNRLNLFNISETFRI